MAEVHIIGQLNQAKDFPKKHLFCKWHLHIGNNWKIVEGRREGQTQVSFSQFDNTCRWFYPIDIHLATAGIQGWPKIYIEVYHLDWLGRAHLFGYGLVTVPTSPGNHMIDCYTWRPFGSLRERFVQYFLGGGIQLRCPDVIFASGERYKLSTEAMGVVSFDLSVVLRNFSNYAQKNERTVNVISSQSTATTDISTHQVDSTTSSSDTNITTDVPLTTCEMNCSISTEEPLMNLSTLGPKNFTNKSGVAKESSKTEIKTVRTNDPCICDLQLNFCDINCCCDEDCSSEDKSIFHHCKNENLYYDTRYCEYMKYIYINNTPLEWHVNQNGLFCVLKSNLPPSYTIQRKQPLTSFTEAEHEKLNKFSWLDNHQLGLTLLGQKPTRFNSEERFVYGGNIWTVQKEGIQKFQIPKKFLTNACITKENVYNFMNVQNTCVQTDISEENPQLSFANFFQNISIVTAPHLLNISKFKNVFQDCPKNVCLPIYPNICSDDFNNCKNVSQNDTRLKVTCNYDIRNNVNDCKNLVTKLHYNFYHNGTKGYNRVETLAVLANISYEFGMQDFEVHQEYSINFWWINQTRNFSKMLSGNPGYLIGKPILTGNLVNVGNKTNVVLKIERFSESYVRSFITLPDNVNGNCVLKNETYLSVDFGYNLLTKCRFNSTIFNRKKYLNGTEVCRNIQRAILKLWGVIGENRTVGMFGNADANNPDEWIKIMYNISPGKLFNETTGRFGNSNNTLTCLGIVTGLVIDLYHSKINFERLLNQEKILAVTYAFGGIINKTFDYDKRDNSVYLELDLHSQVVYYDISVQKQEIFVDPPSLEIKLPYDFFYPFVKIENGVDKISVNYFLCIYMCLLLTYYS